LPHDSSRELTRSILDQTSGPVCIRARSNFCDLVDERLSPEAEQITRLHLESCPSCKAVEESLIELGSLLPEMAELHPGEGFAGDVLDATIARVSPVVALRNRITQWWHNAVRRPRFAWEAAYAGALIFFLALANLGGAWQKPPALASFRQTLEMGCSEAAQISAGISTQLAGHSKQITQSFAFWNQKGMSSFNAALAAQSSVLKSYRKSTVQSFQDLWLRFKSRLQFQRTENR
jgi:hypothetical protein